VPRHPESACGLNHRDQRELQVVTRLGKVFIYRPCTSEKEDEARDVRHLAQTIHASAVSGPRDVKA
jgi:hypothetical protein